MNRPGKLAENRIGIHPIDWKFDDGVEAMLADCDTGIRPAMRIMCAGDFETFESCQGGEGHAYPEPTIGFHGDDGEGFRALGWLIVHGVKIGALRRYWSIENGLPHGPSWQVTIRT